MRLSVSEPPADVARRACKLLQRHFVSYHILAVSYSNFTAIISQTASRRGPQLSYVTTGKIGQTLGQTTDLTFKTPSMSLKNFTGKKPKSIRFF